MLAAERQVSPGVIFTSLTMPSYSAIQPFLSEDIEAVSESSSFLEAYIIVLFVLWVIVPD